MIEVNQICGMKLKPRQLIPLLFYRFKENCRLGTGCWSKILTFNLFIWYGWFLCIEWRIAVLLAVMIMVTVHGFRGSRFHYSSKIRYRGSIYMRGVRVEYHLGRVSMGWDEFGAPILPVTPNLERWTQSQWTLTYYGSHLTSSVPFNETSLLVKQLVDEDHWIVWIKYLTNFTYIVSERKVFHWFGCFWLQNL